MDCYDNVKPPIWWRLLVTAVLVLSIRALSDSGDTTLVAGPVIVLLFVWIPYLLKLSAAEESMENINRYGKAVVEKDFAEARPVGKSGVRLGEEFLYYMGLGYVVAYRDIKVLRIGDMEDQDGNKFHVLNCNERMLMSIAYPQHVEDAYSIISRVVCENPKVQYEFVDADAPNAIAERIVRENLETAFRIETISSTEKRLCLVTPEDGN